jgi:AcrR family transcriptional regulator
LSPRTRDLNVFKSYLTPLVTGLMLKLNMFKTLKAEDTRTRILNAALGLFRRKGFEQTTMREIAEEAGVSLGNAYYYFESKEALVMAFYERAHLDLPSRVTAAVAPATSLEEQLSAIIDAKFAYFAPNRAFLGALFGHAADPANPLSPFSAETHHIREADQQHFAQALENSGMYVPKDLAPHLPKLLWLYQMGLILFWIYDRSPRQRNTTLLKEKSVALLINGLKLIRLPILRSVRKRIVELVIAAEGEGNDA